MIALFCLFLPLSASPFKSKNRLAAENAALRHQLIVLQRRCGVASNSRMGIACSWSCCIDGFHRFSRPSRSSVPRLSYVGIEPASVGTGGGNPALLEADRRSMRNCALIRRMSAENSLWGAPRIHGELL